MAKKGRKLKMKLHNDAARKAKHKKHHRPEQRSSQTPKPVQKPTANKQTPKSKPTPPARSLTHSKPKDEAPAPAPNVPHAATTGAAAAEATSITASGHPAAAIPYTDSDVLLTLGDGNFSFSAALATLLGTAENITASCYDSEEVVSGKYSVDVQQHVSTVEDLGGEVLYGVDGTKLHTHKALRGRKFHKIIFQFPHVGAGIKDQAANIVTNQRLLAGVFASAKPLLTSPTDGPLYTSSGPVDPGVGELHITLKSGLPYDQWDIKTLAKAAGYRVKACRPFHPNKYPGYEHRRTIGYDETKAGNKELEGKECKTWVFVDAKSDVRGAGGGSRKGDKKRKLAAAVKQQLANKKRRRQDSDSDSSDSD